MEQNRKQAILAAEIAFAKKDRLARALAESGIYVLGKLTGPGVDVEIERRPLAEGVAKPEGE
jgi:hypothetical protein